MVSRRTWLKVIGGAVGMATAYGLCRAGQRLRAECPPAPRPMYAHAREMVADIAYYWQHPSAMGDLYRSRLLAHPFAAKVALAALGGGECRVSVRLAYLYGVLQGLAFTEVRSLLAGQTRHATAGEAPALLFAQHYSRTEGMPDPQRTRALIEAYGEQGANDLLGYLGVLLITQRIARTLDALGARLGGRPRHDSTLWGEVAVVVVALVGVVPLLPVMRWRARRATL